MPRKQQDDTEWLSEGLDEYEVSRSGKSSSSLISKLTSPLWRLSNTQRRSSRPGSSTDGGVGGGGAGAAMSRTGGNPFAGRSPASLKNLSWPLEPAPPHSHIYLFTHLRVTPLQNLQPLRAQRHLQTPSQRACRQQRSGRTHSRRRARSRRRCRRV